MAYELRNIDVVFCIDGTDSMSDYIDAIKERISDDFVMNLFKQSSFIGHDIERIRIKVIVFRDYSCYGENSMQISDFFTWPDDEAEYKDFLANIRAQGGGDGPENGLEALYYAMKSLAACEKDDRQIIVLISNSDAFDLGERKDSPQYPADMVDMETLTKMWYGKDEEHKTNINQFAKRFIICAPSDTKYHSIADTWNLSWFYAASSEDLLSEIDDFMSDAIYLVI